MTTLNTVLLMLAIAVVTRCVQTAEYDYTDVLLSNPVFQQLMAQVNEQQHRIIELESRDLVQQKLLADMERVIQQQQQQIDEMKLSPNDACPTHSSHVLTSGNDEVRPNVLTTDNDEVRPYDNSETIQVTASMLRRQLPKVKNVAFTAVLYQSLKDLSYSENVVFDLVETDIGDAYNSTAGMFTAPLAGTYVFHVTIMASLNSSSWCKLVVNGINKVSAYAYGEVSHQDQGSQMLVTRLKQGDTVAVQNGRSGYDVWGNSWSSFSGFLLRSDAEVTTIVG